jgi:predicted DNA-binding protein
VMRTGAVTRRAPKRQVRVTVSLPKEQHEHLSRLAKRLRVSLAWVIRDAVDKYIENEAPLFARADDDR